MAKKFFYVCAGILMLAGALTAWASPVDPNATNGRAAFCLLLGNFEGTGQWHALCVNGDVYRLQDSFPSGYEWTDLSSWYSPVTPVEEISDWRIHSYTTIYGEEFIWEDRTWVNIDSDPGVSPLPCVQVSAESESMGDVKSMFR